MSSLLDQLIRAKGFQPENVEDYLGLRFAAMVGNEHPAPYAGLFRNHDAAAVLHAHSKLTAQDVGDNYGDILRRRLEENGERSWPKSGPGRLCAFKVQRRRVAAAIFSDLKPEFLMTRHLSSDRRKAEASALGFVNWTLENLEANSAALEIVESESVTRRMLQGMAIRDHLRRIAVPVFEAPKKEMLASLALPPPKTRKAAREVVCRIFPMLDHMAADTAQLDAAVLGLYVQAQRILNINDQQNP